MAAALSAVVAFQSDQPGFGPTEITRKSTLNELALAVLRAQYVAALTNEAGARAGDVESLHDMRVAVRRMRAAMAAFSEALPAKAGAIRRGLGWVGTALGEVRDHDVHLEQIAAWSRAASPTDREGFAVVERTLLERRTSARARMLAVLDSPRRARLAASVENLLRNGPMPRARIARAPAVEAAPDVVARRYRKVRSLGDSLTTHAPAESLHTLRIRAKRLRYVVEFCEPLYGKPARSFAKRVVRIQDLLGLHQDAVVSGKMLADLIASASPEPVAAFSIGRLAERHAREANDARRQLPETYAAITGKRWRILLRAMDETRSGAAPIAEEAR